MKRKYFYLSVAVLALVSSSAYAEYKNAPIIPPQQLSTEQRLELARQFVKNISKGLKNAGKTQDDIAADLTNIPEGEELLFRIRLDNELYLDSPILARVENGSLLVSLRDFLGALQFPIAYDNDTGNASGWYIRENRPFNLDVANKSVVTAQGAFNFSQNAKVENNDVMVPLDELGQWFDFTLKPRVQALDFALESETPLPIQEQLMRKKRILSGYDVGPPKLPLLAEGQLFLGAPFVDVSSTSELQKLGVNKKRTFSYNSSVQTSGDFAGGTLTTQSQWRRKDFLTNLSANYKKETLDPVLLGPLKARRYELGDINALNIPLIDNREFGMGARITNADPQRSYLRPTTEITGTAFPGWDVELFKDNQLLGFRTVDDNGTYRFEDIDLSTSENRFRIVLYGLQGEIREEEIFIPVDPKRLSESGAAYDVSITRQNTQTYRKVKINDKDKGALNLSALVEKPIGDQTAISAGLSTRQDNGDQKATGVVGLSTGFLGALVNANTAIDTKSEMAADLTVRRKFGNHEFRNESRWNTEEYGTEEPDDVDALNGFNFFTSNNGSEGIEVFSNDTGLTGPLSWGVGQKPRYNLSLNYGLDSQDLSYTDGIVGFSTVVRPFSFNQQFKYTMADNLEEDQINSLTSIGGNIDKNRIRLTSDYEIKPENRLERLTGLLQRKITEDIDSSFGIEHSLERKFTEGAAQLTWNAGYAQISPGVRYNSDRDVTATLNTRFGLARDPLSGSIKSFDQGVAYSGALSAFVFLDKNGDNVFNENDEPIEGATINAPQNGGKEVTNEEGYAFLKGMGALRLTDVFLEEESLPDPYWVSGFEGVSILPREGSVAPIEFPVHIAGEMDGTTYKRNLNGSSSPARGLRLGLYDVTGKNIQSVLTESDGFYIFSKIPPGTYYMNVDDESLGKTVARPLPQKVQIDYDGTTIYGNNLYLQEGRPDVPLSILSTKNIFGDRNEEFKDRNFAINLGTYTSRLSMGIAWLKVKMQSGKILDFADLVSKPSETIPDETSNKYTLRLSIKDNNLSEAYRQCARLVKSGNSCALEILPGGLEQTKLAAK